MIKRYQTDKMEAIWNDKSKYSKWLEVEKLVCEVWHKLGLIDKTEIKKINRKVKLDLKLMQNIESKIHHDVVAFTRMLSKNLDEEKRWIHFGLTSSDVVDTAQNYLIKLSNEVIIEEMLKLLDNLKIKALEHRETIVIGRTHGIFAEPTSLGLKFVLWYEEIKRQVERLELARKHIEIVKISGAVGNYTHVEPSVEDYVSKKLNLGIDKISTQITQRDRHAFLFSVFANIATTLEKMAIEIRHSQRSEVDEMREGFSMGQKGSSAMPHKKNPISSENITGLTRLIRANSSLTFENNLLWYERDISHSSNERVIIPDTYHLLHYILRKMNNILNMLEINKESIQKNIEKTYNTFASQRFLLEIIKKTKNSREKVYDFLQECTFISLKEKIDFKEVVKKENIYKLFCDENGNYIKDVDDTYWTPEKIDNKLDEWVDLKYYTHNVYLIYNRVFGGE